MTLERTAFSHYRLLTLIGKGGMGEVYLAEDTQIRRQVAAKLIRIETAQADQQVVTSALRLFWREATAIGKLDHPLILPLYDHGETVMDGLHVAYLIIPYRPEGSLVAWLRKRAQTQHTWQLTLKQGVHVIQRASQGLQYAHDQQVMHLDVKPANFLIRSRSETDEYPDLLLSDFGIARLASATSSSSQKLSGTPTYMTPEQCVGQPVFASDQYALAIMAYELLTGSPPFQGPPMKVLYAHVHESPEPARKRNPLLPPAVDLVLQRALAKKPEERYPSVATFAQVLQQAFQGMAEESTLRLLSALPALDVPSESEHAPVANDRASGAGNTQPAQSFSPPPAVALVQEEVMLPLGERAESVADVDQDEHLPTTPTETPHSLLHPTSANQPVGRKPWVRALVTICVVALLVTSGLVGVSVYQNHVYSVNATATALANATATVTSVAKESYLAPVPGPRCDHGRESANWFSVEHGQGITCLSDRLHLVGVERSGGGGYDNEVHFANTPQSDFTVSIDISNIVGAVDLSVGSYFLIGASYRQTWEAVNLGYYSEQASGALDLTRTNTFTLTVQGATVRWALNGSTVASLQESTPITIALIQFGVSSGTAEAPQADFQNFAFTPIS